MNNIDRFYNFIISWIAIVLVGVIAALFLIPSDSNTIQFFFWGSIFIISNIICIYFHLVFRDQLTEYVKKRHPDLYRKYFYSKFWNGETWKNNFFSTFDLVGNKSDDNLNKLAIEYSYIKIFQIFQVIVLFILLLFFSNN